MPLRDVRDKNGFLLLRHDPEARVIEVRTRQRGQTVVRRINQDTMEVLPQASEPVARAPAAGAPATK